MPVLDLFFSMIFFFFMILWIWLVISIFIDIFRSDMSGWAKAGWTIVTFIVPLIGVLVYLVAHGDDMRRRDVEAADRMEAAQRDYIQSVVGGSSSADELAKLADLRDRGVISATEFETQKTRVLAS